ncbi:hypothetical protein PUNSTDRAFT_122740 [Punctularia strigosozonata HHB-11173 SS5]|uniref:Microtubule associated protein n=1 Tax=Punctularia strigosozonata (strain HHB-11173) TaxID=741275 RepID=R7S2U8_PUNST|nr:uncharacterized protein PUNSTDRAFT_122740 [Punctularia strigosozonata HHB-11173 SS5]EIN04705.1 hypothetical protein PUNSTDRAFT_122740 [Punctularia strigosozonata HHB-11173 SS5]
MSTITSLLNSLHTHLQSQTQLLPPLHAQLGLPASALADDLTSLQQELARCIESQIERRRKEVHEWERKCEEVENDCKRYERALGGHAKAIAGKGLDLEAWRKEAVLPQRYQMGSQYQEKLRQLYHTKLEQLTTLINRLVTLSRTLGPNFYPAEILQPVPATWEDHDLNRDSNGQHRDVSPERFSRLEKELVRGKSEIAKRLSHLHSVFLQIDWLHAALGMEPLSIDDLATTSLLAPPVQTFARSTSSLNMDTSSYIASDSFDRDPFTMSTPTPATRHKPNTTLKALGPTPFSRMLLAAADETPLEYQRILARFSTFIARAEEEGTPAEETDPAAALQGVDPTPGLVEWAERTCAELDETKRKREAHIQAMYDQLEALWRRLGVGEDDMDAFVEHNQGSTLASVRAYEDELERMLELKRERMGVFVDNARTEIRRLWAELWVGEAENERAMFEEGAMRDAEFTEELLSVHEEEIRRLKEEKKAKAPVLSSIKKYFDICEEERELAAAASDQSRLLGRGPRDPGRLLREEKMRKRVQKEKPRLEQDLLTAIPAWEEQSGRPFLVHGESIMQILLESIAAHEKENGGRGRKPTSSSGYGPSAPAPQPKRAGSVPRTAPPPANGYKPGGPHKRSTSSNGVSQTVPATRPASASSSSTSMPAKRQRLGSSTSSSSSRPSARAPLQSSTNDSHLPSYSHAPAASTTKRPASRLSAQRPKPVPVSLPKATSNPAMLGHGRLPTSAPTLVPPSIHYPGSRTVSTASIANTQTARAARRESFKPRPSIDDDTIHKWSSAGGGMGLAVKEEDYEDD